jgi:DNA-binding NtrC family response regulator
LASAQRILVIDDEITAYPSIDTAVRGMKLGARDYLSKPFGPDELRMVARRAIGEDEHGLE